MKRPARVQISIDEVKKFRIEGNEHYNIWYDRYMGDNWSSFDYKALSETRCSMVRDCGRTKADQLDPAGSKMYFCYHFAKGRCANGEKCTFFHRLDSIA